MSQPKTIQPTFTLTPEEEELFAAVTSACEKNNLKTEIRVAGGWVRDKVMGKRSVDIDFALSDITGKEFAEKYLAPELKVHVGVIKSNPDQSKHLETATFHYKKLSVDLNNLRKESYDEDTRIPTMELGSPEEDVRRRDFTINALYYNLRTKLVEDYTTGLDDMKNGVIRTPTLATDTFTEDPLRVLRAARFAARFGFKVHEEITVAARNASVQNGLRLKVSRERFGIEIGKMLAGPGMTPAAAMSLLCFWGLRPIIFEMPQGFVRDPACQDQWADLSFLAAKGQESKDAASSAHFAKEQALAHMSMSLIIAINRLLEKPERKEVSADDRVSMLLSAFLWPLYGWVYKPKKLALPVVSYAVLDDLKLPMLRSQQCVMLQQGAARFLDLSQRVPEVQGESKLSVTEEEALKEYRVAVGRELLALNEHWTHALDLAAVLCDAIASLEFGQTRRHLLIGLQEAPDTLPLHSPASSSASSSAATASPAASSSPTAPATVPTCTDAVPADSASCTEEGMHAQFSHWPTVAHRSAAVNAVEKLRNWVVNASGLVGCAEWKRKPYYDGKEVMKLYPQVKGQALGVLLDKQLNWRFANPRGTKEECAKFLEQAVNELTSKA